MDNPVETPLPDELIECPSGSLGNVSDRIFIPMYGRPTKVKDVGHVTITKEEGTQRSIEVKGLGFGKSKARGTAVVMDNLLFSCDDPENPDGPIFIQQPWPTDDKDIIVRALHPEALRGEGAMIRSNLNRVYVTDASLPRHAKRGYLAVEKLEMVETFLGDFSMKSRFQSYRAPSFVVEDSTTHVKPMGYYITARPSSEDPTRIICHLKERINGPVGNVLRALRALFTPKGPKTLTEWAMAKFPDAKTLLFD